MWCIRCRPHGSAVGYLVKAGNRLWPVAFFTTSWLWPISMLSFCTKHERTKQFHKETSFSNWLLNFDRSTWTVSCLVLHKRSIWQRSKHQQNTAPKRKKCQIAVNGSHKTANCCHSCRKMVCGKFIAVTESLCVKCSTPGVRK